MSQARTSHVQDEITLEMAPIDFDFKRKHKEVCGCSYAVYKCNLPTTDTLGKAKLKLSLFVYVSDKISGGN